MGGMATKERIHQLVDALPDSPETDLQLDGIEHQLEPNGAGNEDQPVHEDRIATLQQVFEVFASMDFLPREDAWH
jgi:hypothetical protein